MKINLSPKSTSPSSFIISGNREELNVGGYYRHVVLLKTVIDNMTNRGLPIDLDAMEKFEQGLRENLIRVKAEITAHLKTVSEKEGHIFHSYHPSAEGFKNLPADVREKVGDRHICQTITEMKRKRTFVESEGKNKMIPTPVEIPVAKYPCNFTMYQSWFVALVTSLGYEWINLPNEVNSFARRIEFNPSSRDQLERYCNLRGYKIPTSTKKTEFGREEKTSLDDDTIGKLSKSTKDPIFALIQELREIEKLLSTYVEGWKPNRPDGRLHSTFQLNSGTGQLRSQRPNVQNAPSHSGEYGKAFKKIIAARPGRIIANFDYTGYHALLLGYFAECPDYMRLSKFGIHDFLAAHMLRAQIPKMKPSELENDLWQETIHHVRDLDHWMSYDDNELGKMLKWIKTNHKELRERKAKRCIAEGQLVLTNNGLKPIEKVQLDDKVWDGVEFVPHEGVIFQGIKEVITYAGLTATADHKVILENGRTVSFGEAASTMARIRKTGFGEYPIRESESNFTNPPAQERIHRSTLSMPNLQREEVDQFIQSSQRRNEWVSEMLTNYLSLFRHTWKSLGQYSKSLLQTAESSLQALWGQGNSTQVFFPQGVYQMGMGELTPQWIYWNRDRSYRQQRALRTWKSTTGNEERKRSKSQEYGLGFISGEEGFIRGFQQSLQSFLYNCFSKSRANRRDDNSKISSQQIYTKRTAKVYDILNAGPRRRFTASNNLVHNCVHGLGFGMGAKKLYEQNVEAFKNIAEAEETRQIMVGLFPEVFAFQDRIVRYAHENKKIISPFGYVRRFYEAMVWDAKQGLKKGEDAEAAIAFLPANTAFSIKKETMIRLEESGANEEFCFFNEVHDSMMYEPLEKDIDKIGIVYEEMTAPVKLLTHPKLCPNGLSAGAEFSIGPNWKELKEVKL